MNTRNTFMLVLLILIFLLYLFLKMLFSNKISCIDELTLDDDKCYSEDVHFTSKKDNEISALNLKALVNTYNCSNISVATLNEDSFYKMWLNNVFIDKNSNSVKICWNTPNDPNTWEQMISNDNIIILITTNDKTESIRKFINNLKCLGKNIIGIFLIIEK